MAFYFSQSARASGGREELHGGECFVQEPQDSGAQQVHLFDLNSLKNNGEFDRKATGMLAMSTPPTMRRYHPRTGFNCPEEDPSDETAVVVRVMLQRLPIQDRLKRMKMAKNCFEGNKLVEAFVQHCDCARNQIRVEHDVDLINFDKVVILLYRWRKRHMIYVPAKRIHPSSRYDEVKPDWKSQTGLERSNRP
ncbi:hypothetical protein Fmac_008717 [Flemingia macrophylla]|uniref:Uncharacterized protein n=1 Tax=Flemingia macrophylla TaxID=520843 RepID=A0ABD1MY73_9FABA